MKRLALFSFKIQYFLAGVFIIVFSTAFTGSATAQQNKSLKVFAIGNSFSNDTTFYLPAVANAAGYDEVIIGRLYISGASLTLHWDHAQTGAARYRYDKNASGQWISHPNTPLLRALQDEEWDMIVLQQVSSQSGVPSSYVKDDALNNLIHYVNEHKTNPRAQLAWHMTWAYQQDSTHRPFANYDRNQMTMFTAILNAVQQHIVPNEAFDLIIPAGTAVQNVRTSPIGDTLTRDGYHLSSVLGRYIGALTWFHTFTGEPVDDLDYVPDDGYVAPENVHIIKKAVQAALHRPFSITPFPFVHRKDAAGS